MVRQTRVARNLTALPLFQDSEGIRVKKAAARRSVNPPQEREPSPLEKLAYNRLEHAGLVPFEREVQFAKPRRWRFDIAYPAHKVAVEVEGGVWSGGRHTRGKGFTGDCEKYNAAILAGWRVLRFTRAQVEDGTMIETLRRLLEVA